MSILAAQGDPHLFGWFLGFAIAGTVITVVVALIAAILQVARRIGLQAQMAVQGLTVAYDNTLPLRDLAITEDIAGSVTHNLYRVRRALEG
jgi:hypothetical protein